MSLPSHRLSVAYQGGRASSACLRVCAHVVPPRPLAYIIRSRPFHLPEAAAAAAAAAVEGCPTGLGTPRAYLS
eukprot:1146756-Pelagomonas_calceolata.AAC.4